MRIEKEIADILSKRYEMLARLDPRGGGRRFFLTIMTYVEDNRTSSTTVDYIKRSENRTFVKFSKDGGSFSFSCFQSGDKIILYDDGLRGSFWSVGYWRAHVDFESMTWEDLKNWRPLKEGEYEELLYLRKTHKKIGSWVLDKIKTLSFMDRILKNTE